MLSPPPSRDNYLSEGKPLIRIPLSWIKWFDAIYKIFKRESTINSISSSTSLNDTHGTVLVNTSGLTITLPPASLDIVGNDWTIIFGTTGTCTIVCSGSDSFPAVTSATETSATIVSRGTSLTFRCTSATTWGIV